MIADVMQQKRDHYQPTWLKRRKETKYLASYLRYR